MRKQTRYTFLAVFVLLAALMTVLYLRWKAPPEAARLLPESDAIVYIDLKPIRAATHFDANPVERSGSYQQFIDATGIVAERDLDQAAFALHPMADPKGPNGPVAFTEVLEGRFDAGRLERYLATLCIARESYAGRTIYAIPSEGRTLRVAVLGYDTVAASNMPTPEQIHSILDRQRAAASPFAGSSLLESRYREVPPFAAAWAIGHLGLPFTQGGRRVQVMGLELPVPADATLIASVRLNGTVRIDELTASEADSDSTARTLTGLLALARQMQATSQAKTGPAAEAGPAGTRTSYDKNAVQSFADSITITPHKDRVSLTANLPAGALNRLSVPQ